MMGGFMFLVSSMVVAEGTTNPAFLEFPDMFYDCSDPVVVDGSASGITTLGMAESMCVSDSKCNSFAWSPAKGLNQFELQKCSDPTQRVPLQLETDPSWIVGIKATTLIGDNTHPNADIKVNTQFVCDSQLTIPEPEPIDDIISKCHQVGCFGLSINYAYATKSNRDDSPFGVICKSPGRSVDRSGFLSLVSWDTGDIGVPAAPIQEQLTVPCGLNGPICADSYVKPFTRGQIVP